MDILDQVQFITSSIRAKRLHSFLTGLGIAVGIAAVILLTSMGEGLQRFVLAEFTQFGTNLIAVNPGKVTTMGTPLG
jgi:putative ABC transport system permease protein